MATSHRDTNGLTGHQLQLLAEACHGPVQCDGRRARAARVLLAKGLVVGPDAKLPDGTPSTKWVVATAKGRRLVQRMNRLEES